MTNLSQWTRKIWSPSVLIAFGLVFVYGNNALNFFTVPSFFPYWLVGVGYVALVFSGMRLLFNVLKKGR